MDAERWTCCYLAPIPLASRARRPAQCWFCDSRVDARRAATPKEETSDYLGSGSAAIEDGVISEDQTDVIEFLASPSTHGGAAVERIDTHSAVVFLAGSRAWKLKRAVRFDYLDFSSMDRRKVMSEAEV